MPMCPDSAIDRVSTPYDLLTSAQVERLRADADRILDEIGLEVREHPDALERFAAAGARIDGTRVRFEPGLARALVQHSAPPRFTQRARNPVNDVVFGGHGTVTAPAAGPPMVRGRDGIRRYARLEDFRDFARLTQASDAIDHAGAMYCEPTDCDAAVRHLRSLEAALRLTDKPVMGYGRDSDQVTDSIDAMRAVFGEATMANECCLLTMANIEAPLVLTGTTAEALMRTSAAGQAVLVASYPVLGMTAPVTVGTALAQMLAEVQAGAALTQLVRPGAPVMVGMSGAVFSMRAMRPEFGGVEGLFLMSAGAQLARDLGCPVRGDGAVTSSKLPDAQASGDATRGLACAHAANVDFALHSAGWLEAGLVMSLERFAHDVDSIAAVRAQGLNAPTPEPGRGWEALMAEWREPPMDSSTAQTLADFIGERTRRRLREAAT